MGQGWGQVHEGTGLGEEGCVGANARSPGPLRGVSLLNHEPLSARGVSYFHPPHPEDAALQDPHTGRVASVL